MKNNSENDKSLVQPFGIQLLENAPERADRLRSGVKAGLGLVSMDIVRLPNGTWKTGT